MKRAASIMIIGAISSFTGCMNDLTPTQRCSTRLLDLAEDAVYAPWRDVYKEENKRAHADHKKSCVFCDVPAEDGHNFILARYQHCFIILNIYPYTKGHLLVIPYQHTARLSDLCQEARLEIVNAIALAVDILKGLLNCEGFNVGVNMGEVAKASVPDHLHVHVMPRYKVDAGFAHLIGGTKVVAWDLLELYQKLAPLFQAQPLQER